MKIQLPGKTYNLPLLPLGEKIDKFFEEFLFDFFINLNSPYKLFMNAWYDKLHQIIYLYFDGKIGNPPGQDNLFNNLSVIWNIYQHNGRVSEAQDFWSDILSIVINWEESRQERIHKGSIFYFWSQTAILQGQLEKGFFLIHKAYEEDVITQANPLPDTPAFKTISLNYSDNRNLLFHLVKAWSNYLNNIILTFAEKNRRDFTLLDFTNEFLKNPPSRYMLFLFTYVLARFNDFDQLPAILKQGDFVSVIELDSLFDLILVVDKTIYQKIEHPGKDDWKFINLANYLLCRSGLSDERENNYKHLTEINKEKTENFESIVKSLLDRSFIFSDQDYPSELECDILLVYCLRNYGAHNIDSFPIIYERFEQIR